MSASRSVTRLAPVLKKIVTNPVKLAEIVCIDIASEEDLGRCTVLKVN